MTFFVSNRERRLWLWTLSVLAAIYSTLGLTPKLAGVLRENGLLEAFFVLGMLLISAAIIMHGLKTRPGAAGITIALGVAAAYLLVFVRMASPEERTHLIEYGIVGVFIHEALAERAIHGRRVPLAPLVAILATAAFGLLDECIQALLRTRVFDPRDIAFNALAGAMAVGASIAMAWARRRGKSPPDAH